MRAADCTKRRRALLSKPEESHEQDCNVLKVDIGLAVSALPLPNVAVRHGNAHRRVFKRGRAVGLRDCLYVRPRQAVRLPHLL